MQVADLQNKRVAIWGLGREGKAAVHFIRQSLPQQALMLVDEAEGPDKIDGIPDDCRVIRGTGRMEAALAEAEIIVKSPGVSLYHPLIQQLKRKGVTVTSLLNLWMAEPREMRTVCVTGTKGKSTTTALLAHALNGLGHKAAVGGNIGVPVTQLPDTGIECAVIEVSSYQAADFSGHCDLAILTSLFPEHLDWHGSPEKYYADKLNLLAAAGTKVVNLKTLKLLQEHGIVGDNLVPFNAPDGFHARGTDIYDGETLIGAVKNAHLARPHNLSNICAVLTAVTCLGLDAAKALRAMEDFSGLPHRQQELGEKQGILYVNDSIATTPQAAIAALEVYAAARPTTLIAGGYDRGVDYNPLVDFILGSNLHGVVCTGASGQRLYDALNKRRENGIFLMPSLAEAVAKAIDYTPEGGVVLLSPAAPSYGQFRDFTERGERFAAACGFPTAA